MAEKKTPPRPVGVKKRMSDAERRKKKSLEELAREREYEALKEGILERDKENRQKIAVLQTVDGNWWKMFDHSGAYWAFLLAPQVGKKHVKFTKDTDPRVKARYGVATVKNIEDFEANMVRLGVEKISDQERLKIFKMKKRLSDAEAEALVLSEEKRREEANKLIKPKNIFPDLYVEVMDLSTMAINVVTHIERTLREAYGAKILKSAQRIASDFVRMENGWKEPEEYFEQTIYDLKDIQSDLLPLRSVPSRLAA